MALTAIDRVNTAFIFTANMYIPAEILKQARENSFVIGKKIEIDDTNTHRYATAYDIDSDGSLICTDDENNRFNLRTGSIRLV